MNVSTIIPFLMDEKMVAGCTPDANNEIQDFEKNCQAPLDAACRAIPFTYMYGFVITYTSLLVKLWRVERIFNNASLRRLKINMYHLYSIIFATILIATVINIFFVLSPGSVISGQKFTWWRKKVDVKPGNSANCSQVLKEVLTFVTCISIL